MARLDPLRPLRAVASLLLSLGLVASAPACTTSTGDANEGADDGGGSDDELPPPPASGLRIQTAPYRVVAGEELFVCHYVGEPLADDLYVTAVRGYQQRGVGHHVAVFYTSVVRAPGSHPCSEDDMLTWESFVGGGGGVEGTAGTVFPPGIAAKIPAGRQLVLQSHYTAYSGDAQAVDVLDLHTVSRADIQQVAKPWPNLAADFEIPAGERAEATVTCTVPNDMSVVYLLGHTHRFGTSFSFSRTPVAGGEPELLYAETDGALLEGDPPIHQFPVEAPLQLRAGDRLTTTCAWENDTDHAMGFPEEMCVSLMYYFDGTDTILDPCTGD